MVRVASLGRSLDSSAPFAMSHRGILTIDRPTCRPLAPRILAVLEAAGQPVSLTEICQALDRPLTASGRRSVRISLAGLIRRGLVLAERPANRWPIAYRLRVVRA